MINNYKAIFVAEEDYKRAFRRLALPLIGDYDLPAIPVYSEVPNTEPDNKIEPIMTVNLWEYSRQSDKINEIITTLNKLIEKVGK